MTERRVPRVSVPLTAALTSAALLSACGVTSGAMGDSLDPVVVMTWAPVGTKSTNMPGMMGMAQAFARHVNATGGINGRPLKVLTCNERNDTVAVTECVQRAEDEGAVAVIGSYSQQGSSFTSALEAAGIPYIGGYGITQDEFQSPLSFPVNGGMPALLAGSGAQLAKDCDKISMVRPDTTVGDQFPLFLDAGLKAEGHPVARDVLTADDATDYTLTAEEAVGARKRDSCVSAVLGDRTDTFLDSFRRLGETVSTVRLASVLGSIQQALVDSTGGRSSPLEDAYVTGWYPPSSAPEWDPMKAVVRKYAFGDNRIDVGDPGVQTTWVAYTVFTQVLRTMDGTSITSDHVRQAMDRATAVSTGGLTPPLGWAANDQLTVSGHPRMTNAEITYQVVRDGRLVEERNGFVDVSPILSAR